MEFLEKRYSKMVKKYGLVADKNTQNLQAELKNIKGIKLGILDEFTSVRIPEDSEDIYKKVEQLFIDYSRKDNFTFSYSFGAFDVEKKDFESFDAIKVFFPVFGENDDYSSSSNLNIENHGLIKIEKCLQCDREIPHWNNDGYISLSANTSFSFPAFTTPYNIPVIRNDHFEILHNNNFLKKVYYKQCQIETNSTIKETYYAIFPETDLELPVGNMEFHEICKTCHNVDIKNQKEFLLSFKKSLFHDIDIAWTSWLPYGSIFVSPRVYHVFSTIPEFDKSHEQIFSPAALKDG